MCMKKGLPYLISDYITFLPASVHKVVLPLGEHKFFICRQGATSIAADKLPLLSLVRVFDIVRAIFQAGRNGHALVFHSKEIAVPKQRLVHRSEQISKSV